MKSVLWPVRYGFDYPENCTERMLKARLVELAPEWPGWLGFPWRVTRNTQRYLSRPPVNFHYLMMQRCVTGYAAHLLLTETFVDGQAVLRMMIKERCEFAGLLHGLLVEALRFEMRATGLPYILDGTGPEDGHVHVPKKELELRRTGFRDNVETAALEFVAVMNLASHSDDMDDRILGHSLRYWIAGADMRAGVSLEVLAREAADGVVLMPCRRELQAFMRAIKPAPSVKVMRREFEEVVGGGVFDEGGGAPGGGRDLTNRELKEHLDGRLDSLGRVQEGLRRENEELKGNLAGVLACAAKKVDPEFFRAMFAVLGAGSVAGGAKVLRTPNSTLAGQLHGFARRGGVYRMLYDMIDVRRKLGVQSVERFNEEFAAHQGLDCGKVDVLRDLLDGLEAMDAGNWDAVRDELLELVKEVES